MGLFSQYEESIKNINKITEEFKKSIIEELNKIECEKYKSVKPIGENCFTISFSDLAKAKSWSLKSLNNNWIVNEMIRRINNMNSIDQIKKYMDNICSSKTIKFSDGEKVKLNEDLIEQLNNIL